MDFLLIALVALLLPFVLPIAAWVSARRTRARVAELEAAVAEQQSAIDRLTKRLAELRREARTPEAAGATPPVESAHAVTPTPVKVPLAAPPQPVTPPKVAPPPVVSPAPSVTPPVATPPPAATRPAITPPSAPDVQRPAAAPTAENPWPDRPPQKVVVPPQRPPVAERPWPEAERPTASDAARAARPPSSPPPSPPSRPTYQEPPSRPPGPSFDWESLVGVKLFSAVAGVALVLAAVLFLRHSVQQGWVQPPVRVLIGILVSVALLVMCELKAARKYPATANALDAAAVAILFATFFAAHALWNLIPATLTFGLLALVTMLAVLLSIRRESLFIAVLGLLGGFATPALLSTGENRPVPLFAYLLLLNVGLAWVAYNRTWPVLTVLTLVLTTLYQWGWAFKFLSQSDLTLAMGIFLIFPIVSFAGWMLARRPAIEDDDSGAGVTFERTAIVAAALPVLFAAYLAAVPAYGARADLLFGFLALMDLGLFAMTIAMQPGRAPAGASKPEETSPGKTRHMLLHATGALATVLVTAVWLALSYTGDYRHTILAFTAGFVALYLIAPVVANRFSRELSGPAAEAQYAGPVLLFVFAVLARTEPAFVNPWTLFLTLLGLLLLCAWRAVASTRAFLYFIGAFFAVAAQALWSIEHLTAARLGTAVALYAVFGILNAGVPVVARSIGRVLKPEAAGGTMLLASLGLLFFLASGDVAPVALWALALLIAVLNAGLFIESASARLPLVAQAGTTLSWVILASWWMQAAASVGVLPSLAVLTGLTLITLGGYAWAHGHTGRRSSESVAFGNGVYLAAIGHLFLFFIAINREWSIPPWPLFGTLAVITLAASTTSLGIRLPGIHAMGTIAAAIIVLTWTAAVSTGPWSVVGVAASAVVSVFALLWIVLSRDSDSSRVAAVAAAASLFIAEFTVTTLTVRPTPPFGVILGTHAANLSVLLALTWRQRWARVAVGAALMGALGVFVWQTARPLQHEWKELLVLAASLYAIFTAYPLIVGRRAPRDREPWFVALVSAVTTFFAARAAFDAAGLSWMIGAVPVVQGLVTAVLLRALLRLEPAGERDLGRLAVVAAAALSFVTVAIPLQLDHQWITIGWALEGAALAWLYTRIPHRGLLLASTALLATIFVRLAMNPSVFAYEPRGTMRIFNWYLYTYLIAAMALFAAAWWLSEKDDRLADGFPRVSHVSSAAAVILLFWLLNIEIADYYATGPEITFRFGVTVSQDLTYTIGWLIFGILLLAAGIYAGARPARIAAVSLITVTTVKCFLYDLASLGGLYRVASLVGLALSLALVAIALQKYVLDRPRGTA